MSGVENPARRLPGPEIWAEARRRETGRDWARDAALAALDPALWERPLVETLRVIAARQPDRVFLADDGQAITYGDFAALVADFTHLLRAAAAPAGPVAVLAGDAVVMAAALFACPAAGRVFVALDASGPMARNATLIDAVGAVIIACGVAEDAGPILGTGRVVVRLHAGPGVRLHAGMIAPMAGAEPGAGADTEAPAFILATSGSSGVPKLVVRSQRALLHYAAGRAVGLVTEDRIMASLGPPGSFSGTVYLLGALLAGASVHFCDLRREGARRYLARVRLVRFGGEPTSRADVAALRQVLQPGCRIDNGYGATESAGLHWTEPAEVSDADGPVPAGFVDLGAQACILDEAGALCAPGVAGELVLGGPYVALGEWVDGRCVPGRLIPDPGVPGARVYFTGDLARAGAAGCVVVLGRVDRMLKINGQRVEPMEVEAAIRAVAGVAEVIVLPRMIGQSASLVAFVVARPGLAVNARDLRESLRAHVPAHMLPSRIVVVDTLPRLASGKVDGVTLLAGLEATTDG